MRILNQDIYLLSCLQQNDLTAFECIFRKYYPVLCAYGARFVPIEDAEEIAGDTLLWLWEHRQALNIQNSLGGYLLKSVYHKAINQIKENEIKNAADTKFFEATQQLMEEESFYRFQELSKRLKEAINALPSSYREAFIMHRFQGKSYKDIADILNLTIDEQTGEAGFITRLEAFVDMLFRKKRANIINKIEIDDTRSNFIPNTNFIETK